MSGPHLGSLLAWMRAKLRWCLPLFGLAPARFSPLRPSEGKTGEKGDVWTAMYLRRPVCNERPSVERGNIDAAKTKEPLEVEKIS